MASSIRFASPQLCNVVESTTSAFGITVRTAAQYTRYTAVAISSVEAWLGAAELAGDEPCGITVTPA